MVATFVELVTKVGRLVSLGTDDGVGDYPRMEKLQDQQFAAADEANHTWDPAQAWPGQL